MRRKVKARVRGNRRGIEGAKEGRRVGRRGNPIGNEGVREEEKATRLRSANYGEVKGQSWLAGWRARAASQAAGDAVFKRK
jgi:hypothetical protein